MYSRHPQHVVQTIELRDRGDGLSFHSNSGVSQRMHLMSMHVHVGQHVNSLSVLASKSTQVSFLLFLSTSESARRRQKAVYKLRTSPRRKTPNATFTESPRKAPALNVSCGYTCVLLFSKPKRHYYVTSSIIYMCVCS